MVEIRALGPLEATRDGEGIALGGPKQRAVLALLIAADGRALPDDVLIDEVWPDGDGQGTRRTLQTHISNLRRAIGSDAVERAGDGYQLDLDRGAVDVWRFEDRLGALLGADTDPERSEERAAELREVLSLWRGQPYAGAATSPRLEEEQHRLEELRLTATEARIDAELTAGAPAGTLDELDSLCREHPLRERLRVLHMLALYRSGRQVEALEVYRQTREHLAAEIGIEPGPELQRLHRLVLQQDPSLQADLEAARAARAPRHATAEPVPPSGFVTFLFTDIEGSTRLFHELGERYAAVLEQQRAILRDVWHAHGGYEASVEGDGSLVAFGSAGEAVRAAVRAQRELGAATWPDGTELRVRMGMHSGLASPRGGDYVALAVHEAARVMAAAHGGQILVSEQCAENIGNAADIELDPRGRFRLRGFDQPVRLYEVRAEGMSTDRGAPRATPADEHNLVRPPSELVGRERLTSEIAELLEPGRLVTLTGPGGVGKTRVASEVGLDIAPRWRDGVWFVDLAPLTEPELVAPAVADTVAAPTRPGSDRHEDLLEHLRDQRCVLILDNCEHLTMACRELLEPLLAGCPGVAVLATSREPLRRPGEVLRPVSPLGVPDGGVAQAEDARTASACRLFEVRGAAQRPGFRITDENAQEVAHICRRLDGLPLLIELAAALLTFRSPQEIRAALTGPTQPLESHDPLISDRHRTAEGLVGWSYDLLNDDEQAALRRLSVFGASFTLDTAEAAVAQRGLDRFDVPRLVWSLVDRSLVVADLGASETRYRLLDTIRRFSRWRLEDTGETDTVATAVARSLLERLGPWHPTDARWVEAVGVEVDNLRSLLALLPAERQQTAQEIACSIARYHDAAQSFREGIRETSRYVESFPEPSATRVALLAKVADLHLRTGDVGAATELIERADELQATHGAPDWDDVAVDRTRGEIARRRGDLEGAVGIARAALDRDLTDRGRSRMYNLLGTTLGALGDLEGAWTALQSELRLNQRVDEAAVSASHGNLAETALRLDDLEQAAHHQARCLELALEQGSSAMVAFSLIVAARLAGSLEQWERGTELHARAEVMLDEMGLSLYEDDQRESDRLLRAARSNLGAEGFERAAARGRELSVSSAARTANEVFEVLATTIDVSDDPIGATTDGTRSRD